MTEQTPGRLVPGSRYQQIGSVYLGAPDTGSDDPGPDGMDPMADDAGDAAPADASDDQVLDLAAIATLVEAGQLDDAADAITLLLRLDPTDAAVWMLNARILERQQRIAEALEATNRAISLWPDITPVHEMQLRLAQATGDSGLAVRALHHLLIGRPDDPVLNSEMGAKLSERGEFDRAVPFLRIAAPVLLHENCSIWNYTTALGVTGRHHELIDAQPLLDRMAAEDPAASYPPYSHLAAAKLAVGVDQIGVIATIEALQASPGWLETGPLYEHLKMAVARAEPFSLVRLDHALARFVCYMSLRTHLALRPAELLAVVDSVWPDWFGESVEAAGTSRVAAIGRQVESAMKAADVLGLPTADVLRADRTNFGFLAEMQRVALNRPGQAFTGFEYAAALHDSVPFLRPMMSGLPFLGLVSPYPELARRLGHFCGIKDTQAITVPGAGRPAAPGKSKVEQLEQVLESITVPFRGALFLVGVPGPYGLLFCDRIRALGGIALDIGLVAGAWAGR